MTELVSCPRCGDALDVPVELLGKPVRCASCRTVFTPTADDRVPTAPRAQRPWTPPRAYPVDEPVAAKSNGWVWLVAVVLVVVFGGLVMAVNRWVRAVFNPPMAAHTSEDGRFRIAFPVAPVSLDRKDDKGRTVAVGLSAGRPENQETFQALSFERRALVWTAGGRVAFIEPPNLPSGAYADAALALVARQQLPGLAAGVEAKRVPTSHGKYPALDVLMHQGNGWQKRVTVVRIVLAEGRAHLLAAQGNGEMVPHLWYVRQFFTSFEPLPPK